MKSRRNIFVIGMFLAALLAQGVAVGQQLAGETAPTSNEGSVALTTNDASWEKRTIRIGPGDLLEIKVFGVPDLASESRVSGEGKVSIGLVGEVDVNHLTADGAQKAIEARLKNGGYLRDPHVSVFIKEYSSQGVTVLGQVQKPGIYTLLGTPRLFDAISAAGGLTPSAGKAITLTHRDHPEQPIVLERDDSPTDGHSLSANVDVYPGDTIVVSKAGMVYVVGDVGRPSGFIMQNNENMTVLQALAMAEGVNGTAALSKAMIIHKMGTTQSEQPLDLKKMLQAKSPDVALRAEDIVFVPKSMGKAATKTAIAAAVQTAVGLAIYRP